MSANPERGSPGYTLIELAVGLALAGLLVSAVSMALEGLSRLQRRVEAQMEAQRSAFVALDRLEQAICLAGYGLDRAAGEEPFPPLPVYAGSRYDSALAVQYRTAAGEKKQYVYHVVGQRLVEAWGPGPEQYRYLTAAEVAVASFRVRYYTDGPGGAAGAGELLPDGLDDGFRRGLIRRVAVELGLDRDGDGDVDYEVQTAVSACNNLAAP